MSRAAKEKKNTNIRLLGGLNAEMKSAKALFGADIDMDVPVLLPEDAHVPPLDTGYHFDRDTTQAILAGFVYHRRVLLQGFHGTGKSSHIEQVAARLNWPLVRVNLDGHISRMDLIGRDVILLKEGKQVTEFQEGILPWALQYGAALVFDEYDAARPDVMFVLQRVLESEGRLTLLDQNRVITPHPRFRLFATANTIGLGDASGMYHGTNPINQGQMDRWHIVSTLNYLPEDVEVKILASRVPGMDSPEHQRLLRSMVQMAALTRRGLALGDVSTVMSPRTVIAWAENYQIFLDLDETFRLSFLNKCDEAERPIFAEYYQRVFATELPELTQPL